MVFFNFNEAMQKLSENEKIRREGWENKEVYLFRMSESEDDLDSDEYDGNISSKGAYIVLRNMQGHSKLWVATEQDKLANDWTTKSTSEEN